MDAARENRSVREAEGLRPKLRADLRFAIHEQGGRRVCVVEDPASSQFHTVGLEEYCFLRTLDGTRTVAALLAQQARAAGEGFDDREAMQILHWAKANHLLAMESELPASESEHVAQSWRALATWLNPLSIKLPLCRPDRWFMRWAEALRWLIGWPVLVLLVSVVAVAVAQVAPEWKQFSHETSGLLARDNWLWMSLGWIILKIAHECGHGVLCRHYGAPVREAGVIFILGVPMGYVDATASLALPSKWRRIAIASAGVAVELLLAGVAAIVWACTAPGTLHNFAHNVVITGTIVTLAFNANPLMRFDGYFILADLLELPNLATRGRQWAQTAVDRLLLGRSAPAPESPKTRDEWIVAIYGIAAWSWQIVVSAGLIMGASVLLHGGGLIFAIMAALMWIGPNVWRFAAHLRTVIGTHGWLGPIARGALMAGLAAAALFAPWHQRVSSPAVVELPETQILRAECAGFVERVHVEDGQMVKAGALLVELRNDEIEAQLAQTRVQVTQQELRARLAYTRQDVATFQAESARTEALRQSVAEQERYLATLKIRAPFAGRVTNRELANLPGRFLRNGEEVLRLGQDAGADLKIAVSERAEPSFRGAVGQPLRVHVEGRGGRSLNATLTRMDARASREIAWPALTAQAGGPVALRRTEEDESDRETAGKPEYQLAEPHFTATARIDGLASLLPGETALVCFRDSGTVNLWQELGTGLRGWVEKYSARE